MNQLLLFDENTGHAETLDDQVVCRLILAGVYPFYTTNGEWKYFIKKSEPNKIVGTGNKKAFDKYWDRKIYFLGEGQLTDEQKKALDRFGMRSDRDPVIRKVPPQWWTDLYTDANGNCYSDADPGL